MFISVLIHFYNESHFASCLLKKKKAIHVFSDKSLFYLADTKQTAPSRWHTGIIWSSVQSPLASSQFNFHCPKTSFRPRLSLSSTGVLPRAESFLSSFFFSPSSFFLSKLTHFAVEREQSLSTEMCEGYASGKYPMAEASWNLQWLFRRNKRRSGA